MQLGRAGDRHDPGLLREQPSERDLRGRRASSLVAIAPSRSTRAWLALRFSAEKRGTTLRKSVLSNVRRVVDLAGEKSLAERAERDEADAEFLAERQDLRFRLAPPQRVFALKRRDGLYGVRAADGLRAGFRQAEVLDLALRISPSRCRPRPPSARSGRRDADRTDRCGRCCSRFSEASATSRIVRAGCPWPPRDRRS